MCPKNCEFDIFKSLKFVLALKKKKSTLDNPSENMFLHIQHKAMSQRMRIVIFFIPMQILLDKDLFFI